MTIKMTSAEYASKYGNTPVTPSAPQAPVQSGNSISNAFQGGVNQIKQSFTQPVNSPLQAVETGLNFGAGVVNAASAPLAPVTNLIGKGVQAVANKVSDNPTLQQFAMSNAGQNVARGAEDVANLSTIAGAGAGLEGVSRATSATAGAIKPAINTAGRAIKASGEKAYGLTVAPEVSTAKAMMSYDAKQPNLIGRIKNFAKSEEMPGRPITEAETAARHGIAGTEYGMGVQAKQVASKLWQKDIEPKLDAVKGQVNMKKFVSEVEKEIKKSGGDITRRRGLQEALGQVKEDYKNVGTINLKKLQNYKEGWAEFLPDATYKGKPIAGALKEVHNLMAEQARKTIYSYVGQEGKQAYIDYGNLQSIIKAAEKSVTGDPASKSLSRNVWQFVMNKAVTPMASYGGKILYKTGEGLEFVGKKGAKTVGEAVD